MALFFGAANACTIAMSLACMPQSHCQGSTE
jgi:hypothetical protein